MMKKKQKMMKKLKSKIADGITFIMLIAAFISAMTLRNVTKEAVAVLVFSLLWLFIAAIEAEKKEGAEER